MSLRRPGIDMNVGGADFANAGGGVQAALKMWAEVGNLMNAKKQGQGQNGQADLANISNIFEKLMPGNQQNA
jgi:hypothetical protein